MTFLVDSNTELDSYEVGSVSMGPNKVICVLAMRIQLTVFMTPRQTMGSKYTCNSSWLDAHS
jgi:hypothetical protein